MVKKYYLFILYFIISQVFIIGNNYSQDLTIISWNIKDFGKSRDDTEILNIAKLLRDADLVAIQEVVAKDPGGAQAVARLADQLSRMGAAWDYRVSNPTKSPSSQISERYAFLWKKHKLKMLGRPHLINELSDIVHREPFLGIFIYQNKKIHVLNYHSCTHKKYYPERAEIINISKWIRDNEFANTIWLGDMNLEIKDSAFRLIKMSGFMNILNGEKTSLKRKCKNGVYLSRSEDNILVKFNSFKVINHRVIDFIKKGDCNDVIWKRNNYSDHLPIEFYIKAE